MNAHRNLPANEIPDESGVIAERRAKLYRAAVLGVLALAAGWRLAMAWAMPALARDGVGYCWNARALGEIGAAALRTPEFNQHPLYSLAILVVTSILRLVGIAESPLLWQWAGQAVSLASGLGVVLLCGVLTRRVFRAVEPGVDGRWAELAAMVLAGLLPLNVWLSADVMSEQLFLCAYLGAACLLLNVATARSALFFGLLVGAAFLVRPEGTGIGLAGAVALLSSFKAIGVRRVGLCGVLMATGFLAVVTPYWIALGGISPKAEKQTVEEFVPAGAGISTPGPVFAALRYERRSLIEAAGLAGYEAIRGGRVVVPLLALGTLIAWRGRLLKLPLVAYTTAAAVHFSLMVLLLNRHGYLDPRHALVVVMWLIPPAAVFLAGATAWLAVRGRMVLLAALWVAAVAPLGWYSLRVPHAEDAYIREAAKWVAAQPGVGRKTILVGGSSQRRIAFYADISFRAWEENATADEKVASLVDHLGIWRPAARFFAIEVDAAARAGHERFGNAELVRRVFEDSRVAGRDAARHRIPIGGSAELRLIELRE